MSANPRPWTLTPVTTKAGRNKLALYDGGGRRVCDISIFDDRDEGNARTIVEAVNSYLADHPADGRFTR